MLGIIYVVISRWEQRRKGDNYLFFCAFFYYTNLFYVFGYCVDKDLMEDNLNSLLLSNLYQGCVNVLIKWYFGYEYHLQKSKDYNQPHSVEIAF